MLCGYASQDFDEDELVAKTQRGEYWMNPEVWMGLSLEATDFTQVGQSSSA